MIKIERLNQFKDQGKTEIGMHSILYFESPIDRIFTNCGNGIKVWNESGRCVRNLDFHKGIVSCLIRMDINSILSSSKDGSIIQISTKDYSIKKKIMEKDFVGIFQIVKLTEDLILSFRGTEVRIYSLSKSKAVKVISTIGTHFYSYFGLRTSSRIILSRSYPDCFFVNKHSTSIVLVNYKNRKRKELRCGEFVDKRRDKSEKFQRLTETLLDASHIFLESFMNKQRTEILIFGIESHKPSILILRVGGGNLKDFRLDLIQEIKRSVFSICVIENKYLCFGEFESSIVGKITIFGEKKDQHLHLDPEYSVLHSTGLYNNGLFPKKIVCRVFSEQIDLFIGTQKSWNRKHDKNDPMMERYRISGLVLDKKSFDKEDLVERVEFLRNPNIKEELFFGEFDLLFYNVKLMNVQFFNIFKFLF